MPFFDDSGPRIEEEQAPLARSFALLRDQLERMVALNLLWAVQGFPLLIAWAFPMPEFVRVLLTLYSALAIPPTTATVFAVLRQISDSVPLDLRLLVECFRQQAISGFLKLMPLYSLFFWLAVLAALSEGQGWLMLDVLARLFLLLLLLISLYWGPLLVDHPDWSLPQLQLRAVQLVWRSPAQTLLLGVACLVSLLLGVISIAGMVLIIPVLIMLFQIEFYRAVSPPRSSTL